AEACTEKHTLVRQQVQISQRRLIFQPNLRIALESTAAQRLWAFQQVVHTVIGVRKEVIVCSLVQFAFQSLVF
ncbi:MAG: hypothetical protein ACK52U_13020, partial [Synechococcaceae cyanobacterium]